MARLARIAVADIPCHVIQRGNARQFILSSEEECAVYLELLRKYLRLYELRLLGYCLMSNHVHLVVIPQRPDSLAQTLKQTHGRYATYWNATHRSSGHVWQGRYYSCPLDQNHLWMALRYAERNPVRARLTERAQSWPWSSASAHCENAACEGLDTELWSKRWSTRTWVQYLAEADPQEQVDSIRRCTYSGRPLGGEEFVRSLEVATQRILVPQKGGRTQAAKATSQTSLVF